jgi:hypothetical protein
MPPVEFAPRRSQQQNRPHKGEKPNRRDCTRHSTCTSLGAKGRPGCACLLARRKCSGCACFRQCRNKRPNIPETANDRHLGLTLRAYFPSSQAAETDSTGGLLTWNRNRQDGRGTFAKSVDDHSSGLPGVTTTTKPTVMMPRRPSRTLSQGPSLRT